VLRQVVNKRLLLVLDNFEHVLEGSTFISELLAAAPGLKVLATSRAPLHLSCEIEYAVEPLELPASTNLSPGSLLRNPAVALFVERAQKAKPSFVLTAKNAHAVAEICRSLEGLPLALELAAARIKLLTPHSMLGRLEHRLTLLTGGARDLPRRQQTMRGAVEWSYDLLNDDERSVLRRLSVFVSGCTLEAANIVCGEGNKDVLDEIGSLIEKSLISQREQEDGKGRFTMLEMVREYALEQLEASGEAEAIRLRFARYFKRLAEKADADIRSGHQVAWVRRLHREHENVKAALAILLREKPQEGAAFVGSVQSFWSAQAFSYSERRAWLDKALEARELTPTLSARLLNGLARCEVHVGRSESAVMFGRQAVSTARASGDRDVLGIALAGLGNALSVAGDLGTAREAFEEYAEIARERGSAHSLSVALGSIGEVARMTGDLRAANDYYEQALVAVGYARSVPSGVILANLGGVALEQEIYVSAAKYYRQSLEIVSEFENKLWTGIAIDGLAAVALDEGNAEKAATLAGAAEALHETSGTPLDKWERSLRERYLSKLRSKLDARTLERLGARGRAMTLSEATRAALGK
jgi:predicted ATPase